VMLIALGVSVLVAWRFHFIPIIEALPGTPPMHRQTALEFVLAGTAFCLVSSGHKRACRGLALAMLVPVVLVALEYALNLDFGIDQLLGRDDISPPDSHPGRMSPLTTVCFLAASLSLLAMSSRTFARRASGVVGAVAAVVMAVGSVPALAYLAHAQAYGWGYFSWIAIHTGAGHALLGGGLLALAWQQWPPREGLPRWIPLSVGLGVAVTVLGLWQALLTHRASTLHLLSGIVLVGGFLLAVLLAVAIHEAQKAKQRSRELHEGQKALERLFEASPDALLVTDLDGRVIRANHRVETILGYTSNELLGEPIEHLVPEKLRDLHREYREGYYSSPSVRPMAQGLDLHARRKDGSELPVDISLSPLQSGAEMHVLATVRDVSERKHAEEKLEASREQMVASARLSALGMMAGGIAHEINNPLSIIHAMAGDLEEMVEEKGSAAPSVVARKSAIIRETAERIAKIVKSLRQISREGASDVLHPTRLAKILEVTLQICQARFTAHGVKLLLPQTIPDLIVSCREVQIEQALLNLLQNAFDAVVDQEGERWVRLEVGRHNDSVAISVIDNGPGILPEHRSRIMEPFFTTKEVGKGAGLGLSLSKTIAEEHGGKLECGVNHDHTRFSLVLPLGRKAEAA
jgi:PAS domain S-box-containing protein